MPDPTDAADPRPAPADPPTPGSADPDGAAAADTGEESAPTSPGLGARATRGMAWLVGQTLGTRLVALVGQLVLAYLLARRDFGLIGLAYTVTAFAGLIRLTGVRQVLIHRHRRFDRWASAAFWLTLGLGMATGLVIALVAPLAGWLYGSPEVMPLLFVLALAAPLNSLAVVPSSLVQAQLRFRLMATIALGGAVMTTALTVALAAAGFGAMSFVLPQPITALAVLIVWWTASRCPRPGRPDRRLWPLLVPKSLQVLAGRALMDVTRQGDYIVLGVLTNPQVVGVYYFAYSLSVQVSALLSGNMNSVLLPSLASVHGDPRRQTVACINAARVAALIGVPLSFIQAAVVEPAVHILFDPKWYGIVPVMQVLSLGMAIPLVGDLGVSLFEAQGRFREQVRLNLLFALGFIAAVLAAGVGFGMMGVAVAVAVYMGLSGPARFYVAVRPGGGRPGDVAAVFALPVLISGAAVGPAWLLADLLPDMPARDWARIALTGLVAVALYVPLSWKLNPQAAAQLRLRLGALKPRPRP